MARVLISGSRRWLDESAIKRVIDALGPNDVVIHGGAVGADMIADKFARARGLIVESYPANWEQDGDKAGPKRNQRMLEQSKSTEAHTFPLNGSKGTWDMIRRLRAAEIPTQIYGAGADEDITGLLINAAGESVNTLAAYDSETWKFRAGIMSPRIVCGSESRIVDGAIRGELMPGVQLAMQHFEALLDGNYTIAVANGAYDAAVAAANALNPTAHRGASQEVITAAIEANLRLLGKIFKALREGKFHDVLVCQSLNAIYHGHLGFNPDGTEMRKPSNGEVTNRYSLDLVTQQVFGRYDAKSNDVWKESYGLLDGVPVEHWPEMAKTYPIDDTDNTLKGALGQLYGRPGDHEWFKVPALPGYSAESTYCKWCNLHLEKASRVTLFCTSAPWKEPHKNLQNLTAQTQAALCLQLGAAHSLRTDPAKVEAWSAIVEAKHEKYIERFKKKNWIREDGTEDQAAVKRAVATAYGAKGLCKKCSGGVSCRRCHRTGNDGTGVCKHCDGLGVFVGKVQKIDMVDCRGIKMSNNRFQGCLGLACTICNNTLKVPKIGNEVTCKTIVGDDGKIIENGCDGTGLDLATAPMLPRTEKFGVKTDRDTAMESGDDDVADYGENEFAKSKSTYIPYLREGTTKPLWISTNVLVATGRCSYEGCPLHQMPRNGGERGCIRARGRWCGYPMEMVLGSTDYEAGELCCLAQLCYWLFGKSKMRDAINLTGKPGILHSDLAAEVLGISLEDFLKRLKSKDKQAIDFRQMCKPINFGVPGKIGIAKIVLTSRKKNAGFTVCADGPAHNEKGQPGYWGVRFCVLDGRRKRCGIDENGREDKLTDWKGYPCAPVCRACCMVVSQTLRPAYYRRYPEVEQYGRWAERMMEKGLPAPSAVWDHERGKPKIVRERHCDEITAFMNNGFQAMLGDIIKDSFVTMTEEAYLGFKSDGSPSPLVGSRIPLIIHDEPLSELILDTSHLSGPRIAEIMMASGYKIAPDVCWKAETALSFWWNKSAEPVMHPVTGHLQPWGEIPDYLQERFAA